MKRQIGIMIMFLLALVYFFIPTPVQAGDVMWNVSSGNWSNPSNWIIYNPDNTTTNRVPTGVDHALLYTDNTNKTAFYDSTNPSFDMLNLGAPGNTGTMTLNLSAGTLQTTGNQDAIGGAGRGTINQTGGTYITAGPNGDGTIGSLLLGSESAGIGTYTLSGTGRLSVGQFEAVGANGTGTFTQSAGTHTIGTNLYLGYLSPNTTPTPGTGWGNGIYNLSGTGTLTVNGWERVGNWGTGVFNQSGGTHNIGYDLVISRHPEAGSSGIYNLSGGKLNVSTVANSNPTYQGLTNNGTFNYTGGQLFLNNKTLNNKTNVTNKGYYNISGGYYPSTSFNGWGQTLNYIQTQQNFVQQQYWNYNSTSNYGSWYNSGSWNTSNAFVSYNSVYNANTSQVSLDYQLKFYNFGSYVSDPSINIFGTLINESTGYLQGGVGNEFLINGDFENNSTQSGLWNTDKALLGFVGDPGTKHNYLLSGDTDASSFYWGTLYLALGNDLTIDSLNALYFDKIYLEDISQLGHITSDVNIYYNALLDLNDRPLDPTGHYINGTGKLIQGVPEPTSLLLFATGLLGLVGLRRKFRK